MTTHWLFKMIQVVQKKSHYRYNFPMPPTRILKPIDLVDEVIIKIETLFLRTIEAKEHDNSTTRWITLNIKWLHSSNTIYIKTTNGFIETKTFTHLDK